ncbi:MAG: hypothetical protein CMJ21_07155 [Phycisphaerae bacterium]|nr:hypothetical protein [Phycisphaerae bacterium]
MTTTPTDNNAPPLDAARSDHTSPITSPSDRRAATFHIVPRGLTIVWCLWLLGSWAVILPSHSEVNSARWMVFASMYGLLLLWPALRLSQDHYDRLAPDIANPARLLAWRAVFDWLTLIAVYQTVVWPLKLNAGWSMSQAWWVNATLAAWGLVIAVLVGWGSRARSGMVRSAVMLACLVVLLGEPLLRAVVSAGTPTDPAGVWTMRLSPLDIVWAMTESRSKFSAVPWTWHVGTVAGFAALAVIGLIATATPNASPADRKIKSQPD